jgi:hypothetical protein
MFDDPPNTAAGAEALAEIKEWPCVVDLQRSLSRYAPSLPVLLGRE